MKATPKRRRALRILGGIVGVPVVLLGLGVGYLHTGSGKSWAKGKIEARLRERIDGELTVGALDYTLFGDVKLGDVHVKDSAGVEAASLGSLTVSPSWNDLIHGRIVIDRVDLQGLAVHVIKDADGGSNLKRLVKPQPENPNKKPLDKRIEVKSLSIAGVAVDILQPDGSKVLVTDAQVAGRLALLPASRMVDVEIDKIGLGVAIDKGQGGLKLGVNGIETGLTVKLDNGAGKATLHPLKGHVAVTLPDRPEKGFDIGLDELSADIDEGGLGVSLDKLLAGALALASVEVKGKLTDGKMDGHQQADVLGLKVSGERVNDFLGKKVLLGDIDIETHVKGPPDRIEIATTISTPGAMCAIDGSVGIADPTNPTYDMAVTFTDVDTEKVLAPEMGVSPVSVEKVQVTVKGSGQKVDTAGADASVKITGATARGVRIDGVELKGKLAKGILHVESLDVTAVGQRLAASGQVELATKRIDLTIGVNGDVGDALQRLKAAGLPIKSNLPKGAVRLADGDLQVTAKGLLAGTIDVTASAKRISVFGGNVGLDARASLVRHDPPNADGKKVTVTAMDADVKVGGIKLSSILAMRGKKLNGMDGTLAGEVHVEGTPESPRAKLLLGLVTSRDDGGKTLRLSLSGDVTPTLANIEASLRPGPASAQAANGQAPSGAADADVGELFGLKAKLPLSMGGAKKGLDLYRSLDVHASLPKRKLSDLWAFVPSTVLAGTIQTLPDGDLSLDLDVKGTAAKPEATLKSTLAARLFPDVSPRIEIGATVTPQANGALAVNAAVDGWFNDKIAKVLHVGADVDLSRSPAVGPAELGYRAKLDVGPIDLPELTAAFVKNGMIPEPVPGSLKVSGDFRGNKEDLTGKLTVNGRDLRPKRNGLVGLDVTADLTETGTSLSLVAIDQGTPEAPARSDLLTLAGTIGVAGKKLFAQLKDKEHFDPPLALKLAIPERTLASLAPVIEPPKGDPEWATRRLPPLGKAPGNLVGQIDITGTAKAALAKGHVALRDVQRMDGEKGGLDIALDAGADKISVLVGLGLPEAAKAPLQISVDVPRAPLLKLSEGATLPITAAIRAKAVDVKQLVPAVALEGTKVGVRGTLDWNMDVKVALAKTKAGAMETLEGAVSGALDLHDGAVALPGTKRSYHDVGLLLKADEKGLHLDALRAQESDLDVKGRTLTVKAEIGMDKLKPTTVALNLDADRWLLFGPRQLGFADAPRGTLTLAAEATANLTAPIRKAKVLVKKLDLFIPERFERAHQPEDVQVADLFFLDEKKVALGKLPVPASVLEKAKADKAAPAPKKDKDEGGLDLDIEVADGAHLYQAPIDLYPKGTIHLSSRADGRKMSGGLTVTKGALSLGGKPHPVTKGSLTFDEKNPGGYLDLYFARPLKPAALRDISEASAGQAVEIHMYGSIADRKTVLSGAGSPGALWDVLSMHNTGHARYVSGPDMPESMTVDFPQHDSLLVLSFLSVNLPHLLFLDRFAVWADPYDDPRAYGRLTHFEAERFAAGDSVRVRAGTRPPGAGQSEAEVGIDYLFVNVPRMLFGVGLTGGTRGGGGPGVVWEWSSKD